MNTFKNFTRVCALVAFAFVLSTSMKAQKLTDPQIASVAVTANQIDIAYANLALKKAKNAQIRKFATTMKKDHSDVIKQAVALAKKLHVTPQGNAVTTSLLNEQKKEMRVLNSKKGQAFEKAYIDNEVAFHTQVIDALNKTLIPDTQNKELKGLLQGAMPLFNEHLQMAKEVAKKF